MGDMRASFGIAELGEQAILTDPQIRTGISGGNFEIPFLVPLPLQPVIKKLDLKNRDLVNRTVAGEIRQMFERRAIPRPEEAGFFDNLKIPWVPIIFVGLLGGAIVFFGSKKR